MATLYEYEDKKQYYPIEGYNTNEAPIQRVIEILHREGHGERLDRIVMICSEDSKKIVEGDVPEGTPKNCAANFKRIHDDSKKSLSEMTHVEYYKELIRSIAEEVDESYKEHAIDFEEVNIKNFLDEQDIALAVTKSASLVMGTGDERIDLFVDYNGGPRIVTALELILCNLMKMRKKVNLREISYMDFENRKPIPERYDGQREVCKISDMKKISDCMDLVSGINEYINYGRTRTLKEYFKDCRSDQINDILAKLERFANNMQMCLTDYIIENRESVKRTLEEWQEEYRRNNSDDVYDQMFNFVADDILDGCRPLLEGDVPQMVKWCADKGFIWQAMILYEHEMPGYFMDKHILEPIEDDRIYYLDGLADQLQEPEGKRTSCEKKYIRYYWLNSYLLVEQNTSTSSQSASAEVPEKVNRIMTALKGEEKKARSKLDDETLSKILTAYFEIQNQCRMPECRVLELGDMGELWNFDKTVEKLNEAVNTIEAAT